MTRVALLAALAALLGAAPASTGPPAPAGLPAPGVLVPGRSLGGIELGATPRQVLARWGARHGVCRNCAFRTLYFNTRPFERRGAGVELREGRVAAVFTIWQPDGWRSRAGVRLGDPAARVTELHGALTRNQCGGYYALTQPRAGSVTAFYVVEGKVWGFGLARPDVAVCR